jgi:hypothetical protein
MLRVSYKQVKQKCIEGRFFGYVDFHDRIFAPPSIFLVWIFVNLGFSGNAVSILSGIVAVVGGILMASSNSTLIIIGSFGYMLYYLLDYVDGGVARYQGRSGIGGQYVDWTMHAVSSVGIQSGLFAGSLLVSGLWIIPFGILSIVAAALALDRYSLAWFSICMYYQQNRVKGGSKETLHMDQIPKPTSAFFRLVKNFTNLIFHENYAIFLLPLLATGHLFLSSYFDFRVIIVVIGGTVFFPTVLLDIWRLATKGHVDNAYSKLFFSDDIPNLPEDHFLGN